MDLVEPHILRSLSNVKIQAVYTSCAGCHVICLDTDGAVWLFGRNERSALGAGKADTISENAPIKLQATDLGAEPGTTFVHAACGRSHSLLVGSNGRVWSAGKNDLGQVCATIQAFDRFSLHFLVWPPCLPRSNLFQAHQWSHKWRGHRTCRQGSSRGNVLDGAHKVW